MPKTPFVLGGEFDVANLDAVKGMLFRADMAVQIRDLPDGTPIQLQVASASPTACSGERIAQWTWCLARLRPGRGLQS